MSVTFLHAVGVRRADATIRSELCCPASHPLVCALGSGIDGDEYECDQCSKDISSHEPHYDCEACDYTLCVACAEGGSAPVASLEELLDDLIFGGRTGDVGMIHASLTAGAPADGRDANGTTALMMATANGHTDAVEALLRAGADINAVNRLGNTAMHWAVFTDQEAVIKVLLAFGGCDLFIKNERGLTAAMDAERSGKGELVVLLLESLHDEDLAADALGYGDEDEQTPMQRVAPSAGVDKTLDGDGLRAMGLGSMPPEGGERLPATRGVLSGETLGGVEAIDSEPRDVRDEDCESVAERSDEERTQACASVLVTRDRPEERPEIVEIAQRVATSAAVREGDWRYSLLPAVVPAATMRKLSTDFFETTGLLHTEGNTFGPEFEQQYAGHRNYFYYMNRNRVVAGAEHAAHIFEALDGYTRQVIELHHPGVPVRLERAFGAYYEGEREGFHLGVNEHCDGDANLVSTIVHAVLPDGDVGFAEGGELTISEVDGLPATPITHSNETVGSVVYLGGSVFHHASPIKLGGKRLVFCMFYACEASRGLSKHALA